MLEEVIKDLTEATDELRKEIEKLTAALKAQPATATPAAPAAPKPQADDAPTEDLKPMVLKMSRTGHKAAMRKKMDSYGAIKLDDLTVEQAIDFLAWLKTLEKK
jgi:hypothetical protein